MRKVIQLFGAAAMLVFAIPPFLVIYEGISKALPGLTDFETPGWLIPVSFLCIVLIVILSFVINKVEK